MRPSKVAVTPSVQDAILAAAAHLEVIARYDAAHGRGDGMAHAVKVLREMITWDYLYGSAK